MNIFLINWNYNNKNFLARAKRLESNGYKIVYWVGSHKIEVSEQTRQEFPETIFHNREDAIAGKPVKEFADVQFTPPGEEVIRNFYETESILSTIKQFEKSGKSVFEKKNLYHYYLEYWLGVIGKLNPEAIIFTAPPHTGFDFIIYNVAKFLKIKTILFLYTMISDRHLLVNEYTIGSESLRKEIENNRSKEYKIDDLAPDIRNCYLSQINKASDSTPRELKVAKNKHSGFNLLLIKLKLIVKSILDLSIFKKFFLFINKKIGPNFKKEYLRLQSQIDYNKKFVYMPLHYQPECSTAPMGGVFVDQILMIKILSASIPDDWQIYVKEHPFQWLIQGINYTNARYQGYFETIANIKKVKLVSAKTVSVDLIEKSQAVVIVAGTAGWEAVIRQKAVLIFGYPWYRDAPGVFKVNDVGSCKAALAKINSGFKVKEQEIINYLASFDKISFKTYFDELSTFRSKLSFKEQVDIIFNTLIKELGTNNNLKQ